MLAKEIQAGDRIHDGRRAHPITSARREPAFKMGLDGHPDRDAIMVEFDGGWQLFHPDADVSRMVRPGPHRKRPAKPAG